jgi:hypothetical protein
MHMTANGAMVYSARIEELEAGAAWVAVVRMDPEAEVSIGGPITVTAGPHTWVGTVQHREIEAGECVARVVGGNDRLRDVLPAKYYFQTTLGAVVADAVSEAGEVFDAASSDPALSSYTVPCWHRAQAELRQTLAAVAREFGGFWRVTRAGQVALLRDDAWTPAAEEYTETNRNPATHTVTITPNEEAGPFARPGISLDGDRVVTAITSWTPRGLTQTLEVHDGTDRAQDKPTALIDAAERRVDLSIAYSRLYPAKVVAQDADGTLHLYPDDERMRGSGLTGVPMRHGVPGLTVRVAVGEYVMLGFEGGQPSRPYAALWPDGSSVESLTLHGLEVDASGNVTLPGNLTVRGNVTAAELSNGTITLGDHVHAVVAVGSPTDVGIPPVPPTPTP